MGQCIVSRFRAWRTGQTEEGRKGTEGQKEQYHLLPDWCYADAKVTPEMAQIIRESWKHAIDDNRPGWHYEEAESDFFKSEDAKRAAAATLEIPGRVMSSVKESGEKQLIQHHTASHRSALGTIHEPSVLSGRGVTSQGATGAVSSPPLKPSGPARASCARFFEVFFGHWFLMEPSIDLIFGDSVTRLNVMIQMINFICSHCEHFESPVVMESIRNVTVSHYRSGIRPRHYDSMAKSFLLTMKKALGLGFTPQVQYAWVSAFSCFFMASFPLLPVERPVLIQAATTAPAGPGGPSSTASLDTPTGPKRFLAF